MKVIGASQTNLMACLVLGVFVGIGSAIESSAQGDTTQVVEATLIEERTFEAPVQDFLIGQKETGEYYTKAVILQIEDTEISEPSGYVVFYDEAMIETKRINLRYISNVKVSENWNFIGKSDADSFSFEEHAEVGGKFVMYNNNGDSLWAVEEKGESYDFNIMGNGNTVVYQPIGHTGLFGPEGFYKDFDFGESIVAVGENTFVTSHVRKYDHLGNLIWESGPPPGSDIYGYIAISPDESYVAAAYLIGDVYRVAIIDHVTGAYLWDFEVGIPGFYEFAFSSDSRRMVVTNGLQNKIWYADLVGGSLQWQHIDPDTSIWFIKADVNADGSRILVGATSVIDPDDLTLPWFAYLFDGDGKLLWKGELAGLGDTEPYINLEPIIKFADPEGSRFYATNREKVYYYRVD